MTPSRLFLPAKALVVFCVFLCLAAALAELPPQSGPKHQKTAWIKNGSPPVMDQEYAEHGARYDFIMHAPGAWEGRATVRRHLKKLNPHIKLGTYFNMHTIAPWLQESRRGSYPERLWAAGSRFLARTTTGDTAAIYRNYPVYDFTNPEARAVMIAELDRYVRKNELDWAMLDYCSVKLPDHRQGWPNNEGDLDLDGDGVGYWDDKDEREMAQEAWFDYIDELRAALPDDFLLIPNGDLALKSNGFASLVYGCYIENFPHWFFGSQDPNFQNALDQNYSGSLHHLTAPQRWCREPGFVMLGNPEFLDWSPLAYLFDGVVSAFNQHGNPLPPVLENLGLGIPVEPLRQRALQDSLSGYILEREFEFGRLEVTVKNNQIGADILIHDE